MHLRQKTIDEDRIALRCNTVQAGEGVDGGQCRRRAAAVGREVERPGRAARCGHAQHLLLVLLQLLLLVVVVLLLLLLLRAAVRNFIGKPHCTLQRQE